MIESKVIRLGLSSYVGQPLSTFVVRGVGSEVNVSDKFLFGSSENLTQKDSSLLRIEQGGKISSNLTTLGGKNIAKATVTGAGSVWSTGTLWVGDTQLNQTHELGGDSGIGLLEVSDGGFVEVKNDLTLAFRDSSRATLRFGIGATTDALMAVGGELKVSERSFLEIKIDAAASLAVGEVYTLISYSTWNDELFKDLNGATITDGMIFWVDKHQFEIDYDYASGSSLAASNSVALTVRSVPEPSGFLLLGCTALCIGMIHRSRIKLPISA